MTQELEAMWASKLGLSQTKPTLVNELLELMVLTKVDYTIFFRKLSEIAAPEVAASEIAAQLAALKESFYLPSSEQLDAQWTHWLGTWHDQISGHADPGNTSAAMQRVNHKITWREWLIAPAYQQAEQGDTSLILELQAVFSHPYAEPSPELAAKYDRLRPGEFFNAGGVSHYSCSS
jgi:uncharacterized protein YdiU (UPF0061 family)